MGEFILFQERTWKWQVKETYEPAKMDTNSTKVLIVLHAQFARKIENQLMAFFLYSTHRQDEHWKMQTLSHWSNFLNFLKMTYWSCMEWVKPQFQFWKRNLLGWGLHLTMDEKALLITAALRQAGITLTYEFLIQPRPWPSRGTLAVMLERPTTNRQLRNWKQQIGLYRHF